MHTVEQLFLNGGRMSFSCRCQYCYRDKNILSNKMNKECCFLCFCNVEHGNILKNTRKISCPGSKKTLKDVILYLANSTNLQLKLPNETLLCLECCRKVISFDENMMEIMKQKRDLLDSIEKAMAHLDSSSVDEVQTCADVKEENFSDEMPSDIEISDSDEKLIANKYEKKKHKTKMACNMLKSYVCHICEKKLLNKEEHDRHIDEEHKDFKCDICKFSHHNQNNVILHKNKHKGLTETHCPICFKKFTKKISTLRHMESHTDLQKYQCDKCGLRFTKSTVFANHKMKHDAEENPLFCDICQQQFKTMKTFRRHAITHREDRPRYTCEHCSKSFADKYTLKVHSRGHIKDKQSRQNKQNNKLTNSNTNQFTCIICDQLFINKEQLDKHMEDDHDVILKTLCLTDSPES